MNVPSIEPILPEDNQSLPPARRRRQRRSIPLPDDSGRAGFLNLLSQRLVPSFDFFLFSLLSGLVLGAGLLLNSPALIFLSTLLAPFMAPVVGLALGTIGGAPRFFVQALASLLVSSLMVFACGVLAGWARMFLPPPTQAQVFIFAQFDWSAFFVLTLGVVLTTYLVVRAPEKRPLVTSAAIAYGLYLPVGAAGFGVASGLMTVWMGALTIFGLHLVWSALLGIALLMALGLRPLNAAGYLLGGLYLLLTAGMLLAVNKPGSSMLLAFVNTPSSTAASTSSPQSTTTLTVESTSTASITPSETPQPHSATPTPTHTLVPSRTATITITPMATPVWARITAKEGNGALIRAEPDYNATVVQSMLNGNLVEVLADIYSNGGVTWVRVRTVNGKEGWVVRSLLTTATPAPNW